MNKPYLYRRFYVATLAALAVLAAVAIVVSACSNGSDSEPVQSPSSCFSSGLILDSDILFE